MAEELLCNIHGPYDASLGSCPYCSGQYNRPAAPRPLDDDEMPTDLGGGLVAGGLDDEAPTELGGGINKRILDIDEDFTELAHREEDDVTVLYEKEETGAEAILWVRKGSRHGNRRGMIYKLDGETIIGRSDDCDIVIDDEHASRQHAKVRIKGGEIILGDLMSSTGTRLNGEPLTAPATLKENDVIEIAEIELVLKVLD